MCTSHTYSTQSWMRGWSSFTPPSTQMSHVTTIHLLNTTRVGYRECSKSIRCGDTLRNVLFDSTYRFLKALFGPICTSFTLLVTRVSKYVYNVNVTDWSWLSKVQLCFTKDSKKPVKCNHCMKNNHTSNMTTHFSAVWYKNIWGPVSWQSDFRKHFYRSRNQMEMSVSS